jgi:glycine cleavage system H protein
VNEIPGDLRYTRTHEWVRRLGDGTIQVGITDHAQGQLGDMVFVELPEVGASLAGGDDCAVVESVKAASDVYAPVGGEIVAVNEAVANAPELVNRDPYGDGWLFRLKPGDASELDELLDGATYQSTLAADES